MNKHLNIESLGLQHFCIKKKDFTQDIIHSLKSLNLSNPQELNQADWSIIYGGDEKSKRYLLFPNINGWDYLVWNYWEFAECIRTAAMLSEKLVTEVNYYFVDSQIATCRWVFANEGSITRAYNESHGRVLHDEGKSETENVLRQKSSSSFVEEIFWDLYNSTSQPIGYINNLDNGECNLYTGVFGK